MATDSKSTPKASLLSAFQGLPKLLFPASCIKCGAPGGPHLPHICGKCEPALQVMSGTRCPGCGGPLEEELPGDGSDPAKEALCHNCRQFENLAYSDGRTLMAYEGIARRIVLALKFGTARFLMEDVCQLARAMPGLIDWLEGATLVPVPLHPLRERERGYNQSLWLAQAFARLPRQAEVFPLLVRTMETPPQTRLAAASRRENVRHAFALSERAPAVTNKCYILIDDVFTTGSTLQACARVLHLAGAPQVRILTLAHG